MNGYAVDTNIISFLLRGNQKLQDKVYNETAEGKIVAIPPIAYYEVRRWLIERHAAVKLSAFEELCEKLGVDALDTESLDKAADIYASLKKSGKLIDDADILIAASCIAHEYTLITNNIRHFNRIAELKIEDWTTE
ncbi:MAG: type II toxin-antitoxin system VapC family toxin [Clostridiales bacterium]|nr:type II toxin-antitoxin system VapC family toxin [Clostridiales bacterium]